MSPKGSRQSTLGVLAGPPHITRVKCPLFCPVDTGRVVGLDFRRVLVWTTTPGLAPSRSVEGSHRVLTVFEGPFLLLPRTGGVGVGVGLPDLQNGLVD